jgi:hypothetical protein
MKQNEQPALKKRPEYLEEIAQDITIASHGDGGIDITPHVASIGGLITRNLVEIGEEILVEDQVEKLKR